MPFDLELTKRICEEMGIEWDDTASGVTVAGEPIPKDFSVKALFEENARSYCYAEESCRFSLPSHMNIQYPQRDFSVSVQCNKHCDWASAA